MSGSMFPLANLAGGLGSALTMYPWLKRMLTSPNQTRASGQQPGASIGSVSGSPAAPGMMPQQAVSQGAPSTVVPPALSGAPGTPPSVGLTPNQMLAQAYMQPGGAALASGDS